MSPECDAYLEESRHVHKVRSKKVEDVYDTNIKNSMDMNTRRRSRKENGLTENIDQMLSEVPREETRLVNHQTR